MHTKNTIMNQIDELGIKRDDTLLIHSSMKAIGEVNNGADAVLDAFIEYLQNGLLIFPTHTWKQMSDEYNVFNPETEPSCVGILTNLFMKRPKVFRSWHPTHSVAAIGKEAKDFVSGEEHCETPCSRNGCWKKLYDRKAKILFIGCTLRSNTILHGVEEWNDIPNRLTEKYHQYKIQTPDGRLIDRPLLRHYNVSGDISANYGKIQEALIYTGIARKGKVGDAESILCDVEKMVDLTTSFLLRNPDLFANNDSIPTEWYK